MGRPEQSTQSEDLSANETSPATAGLRFDMSPTSIRDYLNSARSQTGQAAETNIASAGFAGPDGKINFQILGDIYARIGVQPGDKTAPANDAKVGATDPVTESRENLLRSADRNISSPRHKAQFKADVQEFEKRAQTDKLDPAEVAKTYENINRLLTAQSSAVPKDRTVQLARDVMRQAASPPKVDQGNNNTCSVATIENIIYTTQPGEAAKLVADIATTGSYTAADGTTVQLDGKSLKPDAEAAKATTVDGERSFASQLFNVTAVNLHYQKHQPHLRYENHPPTRNAAGGERIMDYSKNPPVRLKNKCGKNVNEPGLNDDAIVGVYSTISGRDGKDVYLVHDASTDANTKLATRFKSMEELGDKLKELKDNGKLPIILGVNNAIEPFYSDSNGGSPKKYEGEHVVVVRDYQPGPPAKVSIEPSTKVAVDNQYGTSVDRISGNRMMTLRDVYLTTLTTPNAIKHLEQEIKDERARGVRDSKKAVELQRLRQFTPAKNCD